MSTRAATVLIFLLVISNLITTAGFLYVASKAQINATVFPIFPRPAQKP